MPDAITVLLEDHRRVDAAFERLETRLPAKEKKALVRQVIHDLSVHAAIEEQLLYPLVNAVVQGGTQLAEHSVEDHQRVKDLLAWLDLADPADPGYDAKLRTVIAEVREHVAEEEQELFPRLAASVSAGRLAEVGSAMEAARRNAPTRPHPQAPNVPPVNVFAAPTAAVVDAVRDRLPPGSGADRLVDAMGWVTDIGARVAQGAVQRTTGVLPGFPSSRYARSQAGARELLKRGGATARHLLVAQAYAAHGLRRRARKGGRGPVDEAPAEGGPPVHRGSAGRA